MSKPQYEQYAFRARPSNNLAAILEENQDALKLLGVIVMYVDTNKGSKIVGFCLKAENMNHRVVTFKN